MATAAEAEATPSPASFMLSASLLLSGCSTHASYRDSVSRESESAACHKSVFSCGLISTRAMPFQKRCIGFESYIVSYSKHQVRE